MGLKTPKQRPYEFLCVRPDVVYCLPLTSDCEKTMLNIKTIRVSDGEDFRIANFQRTNFSFFTV